MERPAPTDEQLLRDSLGLLSERTAQSQAVAFGASPEGAAGVWDGVAPQVLEPPTPMEPSDHPPADLGANVLTPVSQVPGRTMGSAAAAVPLTAQSLRNELRAANRLHCSEQRLFTLDYPD